MSGTIKEYLEKMQTSQLYFILKYFSLPENLEDYDYAVPIIEEILKEREE